MKTTIFVPTKINVGFQNRSDTYTKKLAYVIYFDQKGVLRKETSWNSWRDKKIENQIYENNPTSGFVLNKKVGDYVSDWNHRQAYVRVYDPRDFEFEITIENLLYILENASSIKGKGLEGDFVYGWNGKDLVLLPTESPDYKEISEFNKILHSNNYIKAKDLILGATYKTKDNQEYIYMGRFDYWSTKYEYGTNKYGNRDYNNYTIKDINKGKHYYFILKRNDFDSYYTLKIKNLGDKFIECVSSECVENYADLFDKLECTTDYSPYDESKDVYELRELEEFELQFKDGNLNYQNRYFYGNINGQYEKLEIHKYNNLNDVELKNNNGFYVRIKDQENYRYEGDYWRNTRKSIFIEPLFSGTIEEIYNYFKPSLRCQYLKNNKLYRKDKK